MIDSYIRATQLIGFVDLVDASGGDALELLGRAGIDPAALSDVDRLISFPRVVTLLEIAASSLDRPSIGLEWTLRSPAHFPNLGPLMMLGNVVDTLEEWIRTAIKYWRFHTNAYTMDLRTDDATGQAVLRYYAHSTALLGRQYCEAMMGNLCTIGRNTHGQDPVIVRFQHDKPRDTSLHEKVFRCPLEFNADHTEIVADQKLLQFKLNGALRPLKILVRLYMSGRIALMPDYDQSMTTTVMLAIPSVIGTGKCDLEFVAQVLDMNAKRLQRLLAAEGTTFSDRLDKVRENMARRLLAESDIPVERMAGLLDYSATAPFTTAFKRWTGQSPLAFRKQARQQLGRVSLIGD